VVSFLTSCFSILRRLENNFLQLVASSFNNLLLLEASSANDQSIGLSPSAVGHAMVLRNRNIVYTEALQDSDLEEEFIETDSTDIILIAIRHISIHLRNILIKVRW
jgi:hypothetical protein